MIIERVIIPDGIVAIAAQADQALLQPGAERDVMDWIKDLALEPAVSMNIATVWSMGDLALSRFADDLSVPTPERYPAAADHRLRRFGILQLLLDSSIGLPYGIPGHRNGVILQDVFPKQDLIDRANSSMGAHKPFGFHTDQAFSTNPSERPDSVSLACIRNNERAATGLIDIETVLPLLSQESIDHLAAPNYSIYRGRREEAIGVDYSAVLFVGGGSHTVRLGGDTFGASQEDNQALDEFRAVLAGRVGGIVLEPAEILLFRNSTTIHYRDSFEPAELPGQRRWIQKAYIHDRYTICDS